MFAKTGIGIAGAVILGAQLAGTAAAADTVTLKAGTFLPSVDRIWYPHIRTWIKRANEAGAAHGLQVKMVAAGFKAMNPFQMGNAVKSGVLDLAHLSGTFYNKLLPIADAQKMSTVPVQQQRTNGTFALLRPLHAEKMNVHYLGRWGDGVNFHFYLTKPINSASLKGFKIRGTSVYQSFIEALGGVMITTPPSQAYAGLERGVFDGLGWPLWGIHAWGWQKVLKYRVEPGFFTAEVSVLVNLDTWKKLTPAQQKVLHDVQIRLENEFGNTREETNKSQRALQARDGVKAIVLKGAERKKFLETATRAGWADVMKKDPVNGPKIRKLTELK
ncbi:MAG: ABC transporter substrate-binding protein [Rhodospirillaceae bacterium]|nr:ABC transporter substrate-binding protein [Rhodospirillaceae bacterium]